MLDAAVVYGVIPQHNMELSVEAINIYPLISSNGE